MPEPFSYLRYETFSWLMSPRSLTWSFVETLLLSDASIIPYKVHGSQFFCLVRLLHLYVLYINLSDVLSLVDPSTTPHPLCICTCRTHLRKANDQCRQPAKVSVVPEMRHLY
jgi:hypothetical protein